MASYEETLKLLYALKGVRHDNHNAEFSQVCSIFGNPFLAYKVVHITGTSGKGTVSLQIASALIKEGFRTGLINSPHLLSFRERISVNFERIPEEYVVEKYAEIVAEFEKLGYAYSFEQVVCLMGFLYLRDQGVEYAVIEVGCGGTRDSSNVVDPVVSVITSVGLDHMHLLGNTIEEIATEKAGVIKPGKPCVIGPNTPQELLIKIAESKGSPIVAVAKAEGFESILHENTRISEKVFDFIHVSRESLRHGLNSQQPFRCQKVQVGIKNVIIDVGHNELSLFRVIEGVKHEFGQKIRAFLGVSKGKHPREFIKAVGERVEFLHLVSSSHYRVIPFEELENVARELGLQFGECGDVRDMIGKIQDMDGEDAVLIIGTCFIIEDLVEGFKKIGIDLVQQ